MSEDLEFPRDEEDRIGADHVVPRPSPDRAAWLLTPSSSACRLKIDTFQYEELRSEARALRDQLRKLSRMGRLKDLLWQHYNYMDDQELATQIEEALQIIGT